jgi:hypothetical protein
LEHSVAGEKEVENKIGGAPAREDEAIEDIERRAEKREAEGHECKGDEGLEFADAGFQASAEMVFIHGKFLRMVLALG